MGVLLLHAGAVGVVDCSAHAELALSAPPTTSALDAFGTQQSFAEAVFSGLFRYLLFGGAIRGGKSYISIALILALCRIFPGSRWAIVRKDLPTLRRNTLPTFNKLAPPGFCGKLNQSTWSVKCRNGSEILFFPESIKMDTDLDRWKGLEVNGFLLEEANELRFQSFSKAIERAGSWTADCEVQPPPLVMLTCNPAKNWVYATFYKPWSVGELKAPYYYQPSSPADNPHLTDEYRASLEELKKLDEPAYLRFVKGDWEQDEDPTQLIPYDSCIAACTAEHQPGDNRLGVDPARFGKDKIVLAHVEGNRLFRLEVHAKLSIDKTAGIVELRIGRRAGDPEKDEPEWLYDIDPARVNIDSVGLGAGVVDILRGKGMDVLEVVGGARPMLREDTVYTFFNLRSQLWWELREMLRKGLLLIDLPPGKRRNELFEELTTPRYSISGDKVIRVESKDEISKPERLGRSPDLGDALVYAVANLGDPEPDWVVV